MKVIPNLKIARLKRDIRKKLVSFWYWCMKPVAYFFTREKMDKRYRKKENKISDQQAIRYIAEDIAKYIAVNGKETFIIADFFDKDYLSGYQSLSYINSYLIKRKKTKTGYYKLNKSIENQEKIIQEIKSIKGMHVTDKVEDFKYSWSAPTNYIKTCRVEYVN